MMAQQARFLHEITRRRQPLIFEGRACASSTPTARRVAWYKRINPDGSQTRRGPGWSLLREQPQHGHTENYQRASDVHVTTRRPAPDPIQGSAEVPVTSATTEQALRLIGLSKSFGEKVAVDRVDLLVPRGSFFGLVGPNGAGKTTSLSMAVGLLKPDSGRAEILGDDVWSDPTRAKSLIGVLPDGTEWQLARGPTFNGARPISAPNTGEVNHSPEGIVDPARIVKPA